MKPILSAFVLVLSIYSLKSQSLFDGKELSVFATYGPGKIQWYDENIPRYIIAADQEAVEYSASWSLGINKNFFLNNQFDFSVGLSYLTVTEKTHNTAKPGFLPISNEYLSQGFMHVTPCMHLKFPDDRFIINLGIRIGYIADASERYDSHSFGDMDINLETGFTIPVLNKWSLRAEWIQGLSKYDYIISTPVPGISYFKYHAFQFGLNYIISNGSKHE